MRRLAVIHEAGLSMESGGNGAGQAQSALSKHAAPPAKRSLVPWGVLAGAALMVAPASLRHPGIGMTLAVVVVLAAGMAFRAGRYNSAVYPRLHDLWARSFMCGRCGEVFAE